jgi:hypothetical protein
MWDQRVAGASSTKSGSHLTPRWREWIRTIGTRKISYRFGRDFVASSHGAGGARPITQSVPPPVRPSRRPWPPSSPLADHDLVQQAFKLRRYARVGETANINGRQVIIPGELLPLAAGVIAIQPRSAETRYR